MSISSPVKWRCLNCQGSMKSGVICITSTVPGLKEVPGEWPPLVMVVTAVVLVTGGGSLRDSEAPTGSWGLGLRRERAFARLCCDNPTSSRSLSTGWWSCLLQYPSAPTGGCCPSAWPTARPRPTPSCTPYCDTSTARAAKRS